MAVNLRASTQLIAQNDLIHWKADPKTPKMNTHCERFNRTIQESFVDHHEDLLFTDLASFNEKMSDWLIFYNTQLPHLSTKPNPKKTTSLHNLPFSPVEYLLQLQPQSRMYWTNTPNCSKPHIAVKPNNYSSGNIFFLASIL